MPFLNIELKNVILKKKRKKNGHQGKIRDHAILQKFCASGSPNWPKLFIYTIMFLSLFSKKENTKNLAAENVFTDFFH